MSSETIRIKVVKEKDATMPAYAHEGDAGCDLSSTEEAALKPGERKLIGTGIKIALPRGFEAQIRPRSGLAHKHGISIVNSPGTVDSGYRGEIKVNLINLGDQDFHVQKGMRIAQMIINKVEQAEFFEVEELEQTSRNEDGYGSTGTGS